MIRSLFLPMAVAVLTVIPLISAHSAAADGGGCEKPVGCCQNCCEPCMLVCCPETKIVKEKKHAWDLECEHVCIPKVHCPLFNLFGCCSKLSTCCQNCGDSACSGNCCSGQQGSCGKIRTVRKLKKVEFEVEKCVVEWKVRKSAWNAGKCCDGCPPQSCCAPGY